MPVLSPRRTTPSTLSGSYRSSFSTSTLDRPYISTYNPRSTNFNARCTTRIYSDSEGRRIFTRHGSVTEDGVTTRFREESREGSARRDSIRENSEDNDEYRAPTRRVTALNVADSIAELRNKYSPTNYVPAVLRKNDISRSKSISDIGLPPIDKTDKGVKNKVNDTLNYNNSLGVTNFSNNTNSQEDDNGNLPSVSEIRRKIEEAKSFEKNRDSLCIEGVKISENPFKKQDGPVRRSKVKPENQATRERNCDRTGDTQNLDKISKLNVTNDFDKKNGGEFGRDTNGLNDTNGENSKGFNHTTDFASYIPSKDFDQGDDSNAVKDEMERNRNYLGENGRYYQTKSNNDISSSPRLSRPTTSNNANEPYQSNRSSLERDDERSYRRSIAASPTKNLGLNGLKNIGNTCFMNSVIQCLSNTRLLSEYVRKDSHLNDINTTISSMKGALIKAFSQVIKELWSEDSSERAVNTLALKSQIQRFAPRFMGYAQQDAQEFLRYLLEGLHEDVNRVTGKPVPITTEIDETLSDGAKAGESWQRYLRMDNSKVVDIFVGQLKSTLRCTHCGHCSVTFDPFWDLSLPIPQKVGQLRLQQCLEYFTREETLDGDEKPTCSKCKERRKCTKSFSIQKFPKILVIHLKRFSPTERFRGKLSVVVDFPLEGLDMRNYSAENLSDCRYNLYAISNHSGTTYSGHYTAYCRHPYSYAWHEYNDSRVSPISSKSVVSGEAYVLFYELDTQKAHL